MHDPRLWGTLAILLGALVAGGHMLGVRTERDQHLVWATVAFLFWLLCVIDLVFGGTINPGKVFDLVLALDQVAEGYRAMDERRAIKTLLRP
jgi:hypothetical protein